MTDLTVSGWTDAEGQSDESNNLKQAHSDGICLNRPQAQLSASRCVRKCTYDLQIPSSFCSRTWFVAGLEIIFVPNFRSTLVNAQMWRPLVAFVARVIFSLLSVLICSRARRNHELKSSRW